MRAGDIRSNRNARVLMLGIDAMSLPFARTHISQFPALKALLGQGVLIEPETPGTYFSASTWPTFASGKSVGEHGQYFPFQWDAKHLKQRRLSDTAWRDEFKFVPFWHEFARAGIDCTVLDVGFVLDDRAAPCRQITNWSYQSTADSDSSDPALLAQLRRRFGHRPIGREVPVPKKRAHCAKIRDQMIEALRRKADAILWLMDRSEWQFFLAGFYEVHRAGHNLWPNDGAFSSETVPDALLEVYRALDRQLQRIIEYTDNERTTKIVFALHGMGPNAAQDHFLPKIMSKLNDCYLAEHGFGEPPAKRPNLISALRKSVPYELQSMLANVLGEKVQDWVVNRDAIGGLNWSRTPAFKVSSGGEGLLRLNIKGREAKGFFDPQSRELDQYVAWLEDSLLEIRVTGSDEPLVKSVLRTKDLCPGSRDHFLPDIILMWAPDAPAEHIYSKKIGKIHERLATGRGGNHAGKSFVLVTGPGAATGAVNEIAHIKDIGRFSRSCFEPMMKGIARADPNFPHLERAQ